ncbi:hypothetical protein EF847_03990 [Actinobacteria bacterium YIM 96077]|uniref:Uncharacterized protein n=1 Tax=Phytoactinopolyspora halophila TaxID=1981511 RepID=A0A329R311_9ACTN|nr:hypothetical protein [Phytoactinopolyspora halophila]AYY11992.1 hypothetical protein EF847_03990 [Actinobacteria bacterium YIM 96077]RAW18773.1 hypothetical protein DPM12_01520 [Phytoactinopolyspora halophila]
MFFYIVSVVILGLATAAITGLLLAIRHVRNDGGPTPTPPRRYEDEWSTDLPSHPHHDVRR